MNLYNQLFLALLFLFFVSSSVHASTSHEFYGVNWHPLWYDTKWITDRLNLMQQANVQLARMDVRWNKVETARGVYDQAMLQKLDVIVNESLKRNIQPLFVVVATPAWANGGASHLVPPTNMSDYANFFGFLVNRYKGRVNAYEVWNEPDGSWAWANPDPKKYTAMLKAAYTKAKAIDPSVRILGLSLSNVWANPQAFLKAVYAEGGKDFFDILSQHVYTDVQGTTLTPPEETLDTITKLILPIMKQNGDSSKQIWITEHGYSTCPGCVITENQQAEYLKRAYEKARTMPNVSSLVYYEFINSTESTDPNNAHNHRGLQTLTDYRLKPSYYAFKSILKDVSVTSSPAPSGGANTLHMTLLLHGIGKGGDNVNPSSSGNMSPKRPQRTVTVEIYNGVNQLVQTKQGLVQYSASQGNFKGTVDTTHLGTGMYSVKISSPQFLKKTVPGIVHYTVGSNATLSTVQLVTGDANSDNRISILDYNMLLDCFSDLSAARNCADTNKKVMTDFTDDGIVNQFDYNLFLRELSVQTGE